MVTDVDYSMAQVLANWLNSGDPELTEAQRETVHVINLLRPPGPDDRQRAKLVEKFKPVGLYWAIVDARGEHTYLKPMISGKRPHEFGLGMVSEVTQLGLLDRLRQCKRLECQRWFVARKISKVFCSPSCQADRWDAYRRTAEGRRQKREQMRAWREQQRRKSRRKR